MIRKLLSVLICFASITLFGQTAAFVGNPVGKTEYSELNEFLSDYEIYSIDATSIYNYVKKSKTEHTEFQLNLGDKHSFKLDLQENIIQRPGIKAKVLTENGIELQEPSGIKCYNGVVAGTTRKASISVDKEFLLGFVVDNNEDFWFEPLWHIIPGAPTNQYIFYYAKNFKQTSEHLCGAVEANNKHKQIENQIKATNGTPESPLGCKEVELAEASDKGMCSKYMSISGAQNRIISVINTVQNNYNGWFDDNLTLKIVDWYNVACNGSDPWSNTVDAEQLLNEFTDWAPGNFSDHDIGQLWTSRTFSFGVVGIAWLGTVCTNLRYNCISDFTSNPNFIRCTVSHEMGHNFNCEHDASGAPYIMAPAVSSTNNWSSESVNTFNAFIPSRWCLSACTGGNPPSADFYSDEQTGCKPFTVHFTDNSTGDPTQWTWTFSGGTPSSSTLQNPTVVYNNPGIYDVTLKATNASGSDTYTQAKYITVRDIPVADFSVTSIQGLAIFDNKSIDGEDYYWEFGDGEDSAEEEPTHDYAEPGTYTVSLTVTNDCGSSTYIKVIEIVFVPLADFSSNISKGCVPMVVNFTDESEYEPTSWQWTFPGGTPSSSTLKNPTITYNTPGLYSVTLVATNSAGSNTITIDKYISAATVPVASFTDTIAGNTVSFNNTTQGNDNQYLWTFGDGDSSMVKNPVHLYDQSGTFTVTLYVTNTCGSDTITGVITIVAKPEAGFTSDKSKGCIPFVVHFQDNSTNQPTSWQWSFPGGSPSTSNAQNPIITYPATGSYEVSLIAGNIAGSDTIVIQKYIKVNDKPLASFSYSIDKNVVTCLSNSTNATSWLWKLSDGNTYTTENITHIYLTSGSKTITLIASNECGSDTTVQTIDIIYDQLTPVAKFEASLASGCLPLLVTFTDFSENNPIEWYWTFEGGDPSTSSVQNPVVIYNTAGEYDVQLIVKNLFGYDTINKPDYIKVTGLPAVKFTYSLKDGIVSFVNQTIGGTAYLWNFGDGTTSTEENPVHTYTVPGEYTVSLTVTNECGSFTFNQKINTMVGSKDIDFVQSLILYPNPNAGRMTIEIHSLASRHLDIKLADVLGREIYQTEIQLSAGVNKTELNPDGILPGTYFVKIESTDGMIVRKMLVK